MPTVERPDGVELHWEERGEGPSVVLIPNWWTSITNFGDLSEDLVQDHRLITYDPRGNGLSTRTGPYDAETDADDLEAVLEAAGGAAVSLSWGDGCLRSVRVAARRSELLGLVVAWGNPIGPRRSRTPSRWPPQTRSCPDSRSSRRRTFARPCER